MLGKNKGRLDVGRHKDERCWILRKNWKNRNMTLSSLNNVPRLVAM